MNDRDKLIELFQEMDRNPEITCPNVKTDESCKGCKYELSGFRCNQIARKVDYLLANGVIVTKYKVGDRVWYITGIHGTIVKPAIVDEIIINCNGVSDLFVTSDTASFENSVDIFYPTKEEAEQALAERSADNA